MGQKEVSRKIRKYFKLKENKNIILKNLWNMARMMFIAQNTQKRRSQVNNLSFYLKTLEK